jgi:hypothetical protein
LTVDEPRPGLTRAARGLAPVPTPGSMHPLPDAGPAPGPASRGDGLRGRKSGGKHAPLAPGPQAVEDGMDHCAHVGRARPASGWGHGNERGPDGPCHLGELGGIALPPPVPSARPGLRGPPFYHADHFSDSLSDRDEPLLLLEASVVSRYPATICPGQARGRLPYPAREAPDADEHYRNRPPPGCRSSNPRCISCNVRSDHASDGS